MPKSITHKESYHVSNPIDLIEETIALEDWPYHRLSHEEIAFEISGHWGNHRFQFVWQDEMKILQLYCALDMRVQPKDSAHLYELLAIINERLPLGHFEISSDEAMPTYRNGVLLSNPKTLTTDYLEDLINIAFLESERFYPAFQFVLWGGKSAKEAASMAMIETLGEA